jgi:hypothetical protein
VAAENVAASVEQKFWDRLQPVPESGCFLWMGAVSDNGYGNLMVEGRVVSTHRRAWELSRGEIPEGKVVCHRCDVRSCCNPAHLFLGSQSDNIYDASKKKRLNNWNAAKTHCKHGHELAGNNVYTRPDGERVCKSCRKTRKRAAREKRAA